VYEAFYLLRTRPFGLDAGGCWLTPDIDQSLQHAVAGLQNGTEVVVVSGPPGSGKTAICQELALRLSDRLQSVLLPHCEFTGASDLWRSILFELGIDVAELRDDDARLSVLRVARGVRPERNGLLVIADDAQTLGDLLLEDLRRLTVQRHEGRPVVQLVLCGTYELEERLAHPELHTFSRRIGQHIVLEPLSRQQSRQYLIHRLETAGGTPPEVFTDSALEAICNAGDGNVHCLNQLADHALLLGFANEERPVSDATVAAALDDLKGLPLPWNIPLTSDVGEPASARNAEFLADATTSELPADTPAGHSELPAPPVNDDRNSWWDEAGDAAAIEVGADQSSTSLTPNLSDVMTMTPPLDSANLSADPATWGETPDAADLQVIDPYALLDRLVELGQETPALQAPVVNRPVVRAEPDHSERREERLRTHTGGMETKLLLDVTALRSEIRAVSEPVAAPADKFRSVPAAQEMAPIEPEWDIVEPEYDTIAELDLSDLSLADLDIKFARTEPMLSIGASIQQAADRVENSRAESSPSRRYARLFTRLQERRAAAELNSAAWPLRLWR